MENLDNFMDSFSNDWVCENCGKHFYHDFRTASILISGNISKLPRFCSRKCTYEFQHKDKYLILDRWLNGEDVSREMSMSSGSVRLGDLTKFFWNRCRDIIMKEQENRCRICGILPLWNNSPLNFILDHIDGDPTNHKRNNLRMICSNCNSQLDTTKNKNKKYGGRYSHRIFYYQSKIKMGLEDKTSKLPKEEWDRRIELLAKYDKSIRGWKERAIEETGLTITQINTILQHLTLLNRDLYE
jgi:DNA-directed RNA polymerase subunit RPC12/RpoP